MKLMSFDVSSVCTGWSYFNKGKLKYFGLITRTMIKNFSVPQKLFIFKKEVDKVLLKYKPTHVIIEETYLKNVKTLKNLMQFIGVLRERVYELLSIEAVFVNTSTVRSRFKLKGKEAVFVFVKDKYKQELKGYTFKNGNDITDSILMGLYFLEKEKNDV